MPSLFMIFAGLGLFFVGVKETGRCFKQMSGRRMRGWIAQATQCRIRATASGLALGTITQSSQAAVFLVISMVTAGLITPAGALPVVAWANVGTSALVIMATLDIRLLIALLLGLAGLSYYLGLNEHERFRHIIGAVFSLGILFLGLSLIKDGASLLRSAPWVESFLRASAGSLAGLLLAGFLLTLVAQSSSTVSVVGVMLLGSGLLTMEQAVMLMLGAGLGSGGSMYLLGSGLRGRGRMLVLLQVGLKVAGVLVVLPWVLAETRLGVPGLLEATARLTLRPEMQVALIYLVLQVIPALIATAWPDLLLRWAEHRCPVDPAEELSRPAYIYDQAMAEAETALDLAEREQARLLIRLPGFLDSMRAEGKDKMPWPPETLHTSGRVLIRSVSEYLSGLMPHCQTQQALERMVELQARQDLLRMLHEAVSELTEIMTVPFGVEGLDAWRDRMIEALHSVITVLSDCVHDHPEMEETLLALTSDRSDMMRLMRGQLLREHRELDTDGQLRLMTITSLFERIIWLMHRYAKHLEH